jgi:hypothetical protein
MIHLAEGSGDVRGWADVFREYAEVAEGLAADLEDRCIAELLSEEPSDTARAETSDARRKHAETARIRAARSRRRRDEAREDSAASFAELGHTPAEIAKLLGEPV